MSILLDSLEKNKDEAQNAVPDVHASHFDDEMLSDEWLLARVKRWQYLSLCLALALVTSWFYFYFNSSELPVSNQGIDTSLVQPKGASTDVSEAKLEQSGSASKAEMAKAEIENIDSNQKSNSLVTQEKRAESQTASSDTDNASNTSVVDESQNSSQLENNKVVYQPKKRETKPHNQTAQNSNSLAKTKSVQNTQVKSAATQKSPAIFFEELPLNLQETFPSIELGSYVVSDNSENSFVIIDGGFYKINQVIAPDMILRGINTDHILVEFKSYYVKLPHKS